MDKSSKYIFAIVIILFCLVVGYRYQQYILNKNFTIEVNTSCDPNTEKCFKADCDATSPDCDTATYKKVEILARNAPKCLEEHTCDSFSCDSIASCSITYCSTDTLSDGEICTEATPIIPAEVSTTTPVINEKTQ